MLDNHPPEWAMLRSQAAWMPPLGSLILEIQGDASSSLRHHSLASLGMSRQCVLPCLGARSSLLSRPVLSTTSGRSLPFLPLEGARRASATALNCGVAWGNCVGNRVLAVRRGSFWSKMNDYHRGRFHGGKLPEDRRTRRQQNVARKTHPPCSFWPGLPLSTFTLSF